MTFLKFLSNLEYSVCDQKAKKLGSEHSGIPLDHARTGNHRHDRAHAEKRAERQLRLHVPAASLNDDDPDDGADERAEEAYAKSAELAEQLLAVDMSNVEALSQLASSYAFIGKIALAEQALSRVRTFGWNNPNVSFFVALAELTIGNREAGVEALEGAVALGYPTTSIRRDPDFVREIGDEKLAEITQN